MTTPAPTSPRIIAAADLGSNTVKVTIASVAKDGTITELDESAETIRLGAGIEQTGEISPERIEQCISVLRDREALGRALGADAFIGVATEALRLARNGSELLHRVHAETSWRIDTISGDEEARLTFVGLRDRLPETGRALIVDIGGGSSEVIQVADGAMTGRTSLPLGSGRLADRFFRTDPPGAEALIEATKTASEALTTQATWSDVDHLLFAGGNGVFLAELIRQLFPDEAFTRDTLERLLKHLSTTPAEDTASRLMIAHERARVLPAGGAIALAFMRKADASHATGVPSGIRTGLIRDYLERPPTITDDRGATSHHPR